VVIVNKSAIGRITNAAGWWCKRCRKPPQVSSRLSRQACPPVTLHA